MSTIHRHILLSHYHPQLLVEQSSDSKIIPLCFKTTHFGRDHCAGEYGCEEGDSRRRKCLKYHWVSQAESGTIPSYSIKLWRSPCACYLV